MNFGANSPELQAYFEEYHERMRRRIESLQNDSEWLEALSRDRPHVMKRFNETAALSKEELMQEIEADYFLFVGCMPPGGVPCT